MEQIIKEGKLLVGFIMFHCGLGVIACAYWLSGSNWVMGVLLTGACWYISEEIRNRDIGMYLGYVAWLMGFVTIVGMIVK